MSDNFQRAVEAGTLAEGKAVGALVNGWPVLLAQVEGKVLAVINRCTHAAAELSEGRIRRGSVMCPLHGARFELATGKCVGGTYAPLLSFETRIADEWVEVAVPSDPPGPQHMPVRTA